MNSNSFPRVAAVICHGTCHTPKPYEPLIAELQALGIDAQCPQLPTGDLSRLNVGDVNEPDFGREPPPGGYPGQADDAKLVTDILERLVQQGKYVLVIGHSAGGWSATEAAKPALAAHARKSQQLEGGLIGIFLFSAFLVPVGESIASSFQPPGGEFFVPPHIQFHERGLAGLYTPKEPQTFFFSDLDRATADKWSQTLTASPVDDSRLTNDPYSSLPCAYVVLDQDATVPREYQEGMIAGQRQRSGCEITVHHLDSGHSPQLSKTKELSSLIRDFVHTCMSSHVVL